MEELYGTRYQSGSFSLINVGSSSFFPFHAVSLISRRRLTAGFLGLLLLIGLAYCGLLAWLIAAYWSGLLAWLIMAYLPGTLLLPDQASCRLIAAYWRLLGRLAAYWPGIGYWLLVIG